MCFVEKMLLWEASHTPNPSQEGRINMSSRRPKGGRISITYSVDAFEIFRTESSTTRLRFALNDNYENYSKPSSLITFNKY